MEKKVLRLLIGVLCLAMMAGCAAKKAYVPADVMSQAKAEDLVQKVDNFDVVFDKSDSMNAESRLNIAKQTTSEMVQTIPADLKFNSALRLFGVKGMFAQEESSWLEYGMTSFKKEAFLKAVDDMGDRGFGRTPLGRALAGAGDDLKGLSGNSAIIVVSDFEEIEGVDDIRPKSVIENVAKLKAAYGDRLCIYPIHVDKDPMGQKLAQEIVKEAGCGFVENAGNLATPAAMALYVKKVFFGPAPPKPVAEEKPVVVMEEKKAAEEQPAVVEVSKLDAVYFDFDKYTLKPEARGTLKKNAEELMKNKNDTLVVEGHCDERGTTEYNMALGARRATEAKKYLVNLGVEEARIKTISYGKEKPLDPGHTEEAWAKNRRAQFVLNAGK